jgi:hypothetical protein
MPAVPERVAPASASRNGPVPRVWCTEGGAGNSVVPFCAPLAERTGKRPRGAFQPSRIALGRTHHTPETGLSGALRSFGAGPRVPGGLPYGRFYLDAKEIANASSPHGRTGSIQCSEGNDRATNALFRPAKPRGATCKSLIVLNLWLTLNQRVPGSSPGAPTKLFKDLAAGPRRHSDRRSAAIPTNRLLLFALRVAFWNRRSAACVCVSHRLVAGATNDAGQQHATPRPSDRCRRLR